MMDTEKEIRKTNEVVLNLLEKDPRTRKDDKWLIVETLRELGFKIYLDYSEFKNMPSFETITRCRRAIQKDREDLQDKDVQEKRDKRENDFKEYFGYSFNREE